jgi:hypothetical protein
MICFAIVGVGVGEGVGGCVYVAVIAGSSEGVAVVGGVRVGLPHEASSASPTALANSIWGSLPKNPIFGVFCAFSLFSRVG